MTLFGPIMGIFSKKIIMDIFHVRVYVCFNYIQDLINQLYHVGLRSTFAWSHVNPLMWNRLF